MASGAGVPRTAAVDSPDGLRAAVDAAIASDTLTTIVAKVDAHYEPPRGTAGFVTDLTLLENRFEFARWLKGANPLAG
jgi:hypothetical protein